MSYTLNLFVFCVLCILSYSALQSEGTCDSMLLSLSSAGICEDGYCRTKEIANTRIKLGSGHSVCFRIDQHQFQLVDKTVNLTILGSWLSYPVRDCYLSDDPQVSFEGYCACSLSSPVDCSSCPIDYFADGDTICVDGVNRGTGCFGFRTASHCMKITYDGGSRYKVCSVGKPKLEVMYKFFDTYEYHTGIVDLTEDTTIKSSQAEISFTNVDKLPKFDRSIVIDLLNPFRIYAVPSDKINQIDTFDPTLPGWYRRNKTISKDTKNLISVTVPDCENDYFIASSGHSIFSYFLSSHPEYSLETQLPGGLLSDTDAETVQVQQTIYDPPLPALKQGAYFLTVDGTIMPIGLDSELDPTQVGTRLYNGSIYTNWGSFNGIEFSCTDFYTVSSVQAGTTYFIDSLSVCSRSDDPASGQSLWGICVKHVTNPDPGVSSEIIDCDHSLNFKATMWPDNIRGDWGVSANSTAHYMSFKPIGAWEPQYNISSDHIITSNVDTIANAVVQFSNITIAFEITNVQPQIVQIDHDNDIIYVWAESTSVKGNCILMTSDDLCPTKNIELTLAQNKFKLDIAVRKFKGDVVITIQCYKNKDSAKFYIEVDKGDVDIVDNTIKPDDLRRLDKEISSWGKATKSAGKFLSFVSGSLGILYNLTGNYISDIIVGIILNIILFVALIAVVIGIIKLVKYLFMKIRMKIRNRGTIIGRIKKS